MIARMENMDMGWDGHLCKIALNTFFVPFGFVFASSNTLCF